MIYQINGIRYRFLCGFNAPDMIYEGPVLGTVALDDYEFEVCRSNQNDGFYFGSVPHGTTTLSVAIYSDADVSELSLEMFDLQFVLPEAD